MRGAYKNLILGLLGVLIGLNPFIAVVGSTANFARAAESEPESVNDSLKLGIVSVPNQASYGYTPIADKKNADKLKLPSAYFALAEKIGAYTDPNKLLDLSDLGRQAKIILPQNDFKKLKSLQCLLNILPDYNQDIAALAKDLPQEEKNKVDQAVSKEKNEKNPRYKNAVEYLSYLKLGKAEDSEQERIKNRNLFRAFVNAAEKNKGNAYLLNAWQQEAQNVASNKNPSVGLNTLSCVTGLDANYLQAKLVSSSKSEVGRIISNAVNNLDIDIRVIKTLVYLITPKNKGGAGHWRVRITKLLQTRELSHESDAILTSNLDKAGTAGGCEEGMTAAECGQQNNQQPDIQITDKDGSSYQAWLQSNDKNEQEFLSSLTKDEKQKASLSDMRNISSHYTGQAVDISELDDIRCVKRKVPNVGNPKSYKQPVKPIKLAWQTQEGWDKSGGMSNLDMMGFLKNMAAESIADFLDSMGGDFSEYDGDLSKANFSDIVRLLGQSLLAYMFNTGGPTQGGQDVGSSLKSLGGVYLADYLGLPRHIFQNQDLTDTDAIKVAIGRAAIEKRLDLPFGSLDGENLLPGNKLEKVIERVGEVKIEKEMNLNAGDLESYFAKAGEPFDIFVGRKVIEKELSLKKDSWPRENSSFADTAKSISSIRADIIKMDPGSADSILHIPGGTTKSFIEGRIKSSQLAQIAGSNRIKDTAFGLKYFSLNNPAYQLPGPTKDHPEVTDTWGEALKGNVAALKTIGVYTLARLLGQDNFLFSELPDNAQINKITVTEEGTVKDIGTGEFGYYVFRQWLRQNMTSTDCQVPQAATSIDYSFNNNGSQIASGTYKAGNQTYLTPEVRVSYDVNYSQGSQQSTLSRSNWIIKINEEKARQIGLQNYDLKRLFGCSSTNGKSVYSRIGSTLLYIGIANKLLSKEENAKIDLLDINPQLKIDNPELNFYLTRILRAQQLMSEIEGDWQEIKADDWQGDETKARIDAIMNDLRRIYDNGDPDPLKVQKIIDTAANIIIELDQLQDHLQALKNRYETTENIMRSKIDQINALLAKADELIHVLSEILAGHPIDSSDTLSLSQINTNKLGSNSSRNRQGLTPAQIAKIVFLMIAGKISPEEAMIRIGATIAESNLNLPANTLVYLYKNYEQRGVRSSNALIEAIGQARIEEEFGMPMAYFEGFTFAPTPDFRKPSDIQRWLPDGHPWKDLPDSTFADFYKNLPSESERPQVDGPADPDYSKEELAASARDNWERYNQSNIKKYGQVSLGEKTIDDVVKNIRERQLNFIADPQNDLLFKMGLPEGQYSALKSNSPTAWSGATSRTNTIDKLFSIPQGSTKSLFTGQSSLSSTNLGRSEKEIVSAKMQISKVVIEKYIQLLNREVLPSELDQVDPSLEPDFTQLNPYLPSTSCPINFKQIDGYSVNDTVSAANSFDYYDTKGKHSFQSWEDAQRYANAHKEDRIKGNVYGVMAAALYRITSLPGLTPEILESKIRQFATNANTTSVFSASEWNALEEKTDLAVPVDLLRQLFSRESIELPVPNYKKLVGKEEAKKIITKEIFSALGINLDIAEFDYTDFYNILNGDFSSLTRLATNFIDEELSLPHGTTAIILSANTPETISCALKEAGGAILGNVFGLDYVNFQGNLLNNLGQSKIEETLNLPRGTFTGSSVADVMTKVRPVNFAAAFKIPFTGNQIYPYTNRILGTEYSERLEGTSGNYQLEKIKEQITTHAVLSNEAMLALGELDRFVTNTTNSFLSELKTAPENLPVKITELQNASQSDRERFNAVGEFFSNISTIDNLLGINHYKSAEMLTGLLTPDDFAKLVGEKLATRTAITGLGEALGLDKDAAQGVADLVNTIESVFTCQKKSSMSILGIGSSRRASTGGEPACYDPNYHNWGLILQNLDKIFKFKLDERLNLPPGTIDKVITHPNDAFPILLDIGAQKLDSAFKLDSTKYSSFSGLYRAFYGEESWQNSSVPGQIDRQCHEQAYPGGLDVALELQRENDERNVRRVSGQFPPGLPARAPNESDSAYMTRVNNAGGDSASRYIDWKRRYDEAVFTLAETENQIAQRNRQEQECMVNARTDDLNRQPPGSKRPEGIGTIGQISFGYSHTEWKERLVEWGMNVIAEQIHDTIFNIKVVTGKDAFGHPIETRVGVDMPITDIRKALGGDLRYLGAAMIAMSANLLMIPLDKMGTRNCNEKVSGECRMAVPEEMRISYDDIKLAMIGMPSYDAQGIAAWQEYHGDQPENPERYRGDFTSAFVDSLDDTSDPNSTVDGRVKSSVGYDRTEADSARASGDPGTNVLRNPSEYYSPTLPNGQPNPKFTPERKARLEGVQSRVRAEAIKNLSFKTLDIALWKLDENIFPGFSRAVIDGDIATKAGALAKYIQNGLRNGHLFGINFDPLDPGWLLVTQFAYKTWLDGDPSNNAAALEQFVEKDGLTFLSNFISHNSKGWFGFDLGPDMSKGLIVGLATGNWGLGAISLDGAMGISGSESVKIGNQTVPTLGGAVVNWGVGKLFSWTDKFLGLKDGQSFELFRMGVEAYKTWKIYNELKNVKDLANLSKEAKAFMEAKKLTDTAKGAEQAKAQLQLNYSLIAYKITEILVDKLLGNTISSVEESLGMIPGTLSGLVTVAVYNFAVVPAVNAVSAAMGYGSVLGPMGWGLAIAIAIIGYLAGAKYYYYCDADGYYPTLEQPDYNRNDISEIGEWGGRIGSDPTGLGKLMQEKAIESAQYKAQRLIGDLLSASQQPKFNDALGEPLIPIQILTGRKEDVTYWDHLIDQNICKAKLGEDAMSIDGICGTLSLAGKPELTKMGVWANPQTTAWTHIGF